MAGNPCAEGPGSWYGKCGTPCRALRMVPAAPGVHSHQPERPSSKSDGARGEPPSRAARPCRGGADRRARTERQSSGSAARQATLESPYPPGCREPSLGGRRALGPRDPCRRARRRDAPVALPARLRLGSARLFRRSRGGAARRRLDCVRLLADAQRHHSSGVAGAVLLGPGTGRRTGAAADRLCCLPGGLALPYSTQSAMQMFVSPGLAALRLEAKASRFPSGLNIGKPSNSGLVVTRSNPLPSRFTR